MDDRRFPQYARFLNAYDMPPAASSPTMRERMGALRAKLSAVLDEARAIEAEMIEAEVEGAVKDFAATWMRLANARAEVPAERKSEHYVEHAAGTPGAFYTGVDAWDEVFDALTRSAITALPVPVDGKEWNTLLRRHTMVNIDIVDGPMMDSVRRVFGPDEAEPARVIYVAVPVLHGVPTVENVSSAEPATPPAV